MATLFIDDEMAVVALYTDYQYKWMLNSLDEARVELDAMHRARCAALGTTAVAVEAVVRERTKQIALRYFYACFDSKDTELTFRLSCSVAPVFNSGRDVSFGMLNINGVKSLNDIPMQIFVKGDRVQLSWGNWHVPERDIAHGPAIVKIGPNNKFRGYHVKNGQVIKGLRNWRKRCVSHNLWMSLCV